MELLLWGIFVSILVAVIYKSRSDLSKLEKVHDELVDQYSRLQAETVEDEKANEALRVETNHLEAQIRSSTQSHERNLAEKEKELAKANAALKDTKQRHLRIIEEKDEENRGLKEAVRAISNQFANDSVRYIISALTANNLETQRKKLEKVFSLIRGHKIVFPTSDENEFYQKLEAEWKLEVKRQFNREEQQRIKEQIREEVKAERERQAEIDRIEKEQKLIQAALDKALKENNDQHSEEIERLKNQLADVIASHQRAVSQAQLTRSGHVYVISNIGSFGEDVFKIGMTRRTKPEERISELSGAAVPFGFDVQLMISCNDAPTLENLLHRELNELRINKVNARKEFFKVCLKDIVTAVEKHHGKVEYISTPEAPEYRETKLIEARGGSSLYDSEFGDDDDLEGAA